MLSVQMSPKQILQQKFQQDVTSMLEQHDFRFLRSQFAYKRTTGPFIQNISITLSHHNSATNMKFWSQFCIASPDYNVWLKSQGRDPFPFSLGGCTHWNIPGWIDSAESGTHYEFSAEERLNQAVQDWLQQSLNVGIPFLNQLSCWAGLAADLVRQRSNWSRAADFYVMADQPSQAIETLRAGITHLRQQDFSYSENAHPILIQKRQRAAKERDDEIQAMETRISELTNSPP